MGLSRRTSYLYIQVGWITPSQCFFSVEMSAKDRETEELRENLIPLPTPAPFREGISCTSDLFPSVNVSLSCQDGVQKSLDHQGDSRGGLALHLLPGVGPFAKVNLYRCELSCCEPAPPQLTKLPCLLP